jgi:mannose-6-phosphate isomerase-like protein (cupin superfamily)
MIKAIVGDAADRCAPGCNSLWPMPSGVTAATRQASPVARGGARSSGGESACLRNRRLEVRILAGASDRDQRERKGRRVSRRIAAVPFTLRNLKEDLDDVGSNFDGAPDLEFRLATKALELEHSGLCYQRIPPGCRFPYGHTHKEQEEVYVVVCGSGRMKLDDEIVEIKEWDVVRVPPGTWRGYESGSQGLEILVFGAPNLGENPRDDVEGQRDWWDE